MHTLASHWTTVYKFPILPIEHAVTSLTDGRLYLLLLKLLMFHLGWIQQPALTASMPHWYFLTRPKQLSMALPYFVGWFGRESLVGTVRLRPSGHWSVCWPWAGAVIVSAIAVIYTSDVARCRRRGICMYIWGGGLRNFISACSMYVVCLLVRGKRQNYGTD